MNGYDGKKCRMKMNKGYEDGWHDGFNDKIERASPAELLENEHVRKLANALCGVIAQLGQFHGKSIDNAKSVLKPFAEL